MIRPVNPILNPISKRNGTDLSISEFTFVEQSLGAVAVNKLVKGDDC